jgi:hypothetical protein
MNFENDTQRLVDGDDRAVTHIPRSPVRSVEILGAVALSEDRTWRARLSV